MSASPALASVAQTIDLIARSVQLLPVIELNMESAVGLTLARPVTADMDHPPFARSIMDGFAVRSADCTAGGVTLHVVGEVPAGRWPDRAVGPGEAIAINTGAPIPLDADAVVPIEDVQLPVGREAANGWRHGGEVTLLAAVAKGAAIAPLGSNVRAGDVVLPAGTRLESAQIAAAAAVGSATVSVYRRPRLAILSTGDELVRFDERPQGAQIRDANSPMLVAQAREAGCEVIELGRVADREDLIADAVRRGLDADVLCISGGVSVGEHDWVPSVLKTLGVRFTVHKVSIKPGKPSLVGIGPRGQIVFGLPGNPVSSFVCFHLFVRAALAGMQGRAVGLPAMIAATLGAPLKPAGTRAEFLPALLAREADARYQISPVPWQGSGDPFGLARANSLLVREGNEPARNAGDVVPAIPLAGLPVS